MRIRTRGSFCWWWSLLRIKLRYVIFFLVFCFLISTTFLYLFCPSLIWPPFPSPSSFAPTLIWFFLVNNTNNPNRFRKNWTVLWTWWWRLRTLTTTTRSSSGSPTRPPSQKPLCQVGSCLFVICSLYTASLYKTTIMIENTKTKTYS